VKAYPHVVADFTYVKDEVCTPYPVTFSYTAAALNGTQFEWDFGEGSTETRTDKQSFKHTFDNDAPNSVKTYNIKLVSTDLNTGCTDNITKPIEVYPRLVPAFTQDTYEGCNPLPVKFTNKTTGLADYLWDFGDSQSSAETSPSHLF
jgi:PKD repeat protein